MIFSVFQTIFFWGYYWFTRKPRFPMDQRPLVEGRIANLFLDVFEFCGSGKPSKKKIQNMNFFQIGPDPPPLKFEPEFLKKFF